MSDEINITADVVYIGCASSCSKEASAGARKEKQELIDLYNKYGASISRFHEGLIGLNKMSMIEIENITMMSNEALRDAYNLGVARYPKNEDDSFVDPKLL